MAVNRPILVKRGWTGEIVVNEIKAFLGEYVIFELPLDSGSVCELRMPVEDALAEGLICAADKIVYSPEEEEDYLG
jgi:hypothetical protein